MIQFISTNPVRLTWSQVVNPERAVAIVRAYGVHSPLGEGVVTYSCSTGHRTLVLFHQPTDSYTRVEAHIDEETTRDAITFEILDVIISELRD